MFFGTGHADIKQPALFLERFVFADRAAVGEQSILQPNNEHHRELQPLGRMQGHQHDWRPFIVIVLVRHQGRVVQKVPNALSTLYTLNGGVQKFADVVDPSMGFLGSLLLQHFDIAAFPGDAIEQLPRRKGFGKPDELVHERAK